MLRHLRESGSIEQDADTVLFLHPVKSREQYLTEKRAAEKHGHDAELIIAKQRNGETATFQLEWFDEITKFDDFNPPMHNQFAGDFAHFGGES